MEKGPLLRTHFRLMALLNAGDCDEAYNLTTDEYRATHTAAEFRSEFELFEGFLVQDPNAPVTFRGFSSAKVFEHESHDLLYSGPTFTYRRQRGEWRFTGEHHHYLD